MAEQKKQAKEEENVLAILALIFSFLIPPVGLVLGIISYYQIKRTKEHGKGLAVASIIISGILIFLFIIIMFLLFAVILNNIPWDMGNITLE